MRRIAALLALGCVAGCEGGFWSEPPTTGDQAATVAVVRGVAVAGCVQLSEALNHTERALLGDSLIVVGDTLRQADATTLAADLAEIDPHVAPYASAIAGVALLAVERVKPEVRASTLYAAVKGVVIDCARSVASVEG